MARRQFDAQTLRRKRRTRERRAHRRTRSRRRSRRRGSLAPLHGRPSQQHAVRPRELTPRKAPRLPLRGDRVARILGRAAASNGRGKPRALRMARVPRPFRGSSFALSARSRVEGSQASGSLAIRSDCPLDADRVGHYSDSDAQICRSTLSQIQRGAISQHAAGGGPVDAERREPLGCCSANRVAAIILAGALGSKSCMATLVVAVRFHLLRLLSPGYRGGLSTLLR
jgi:hypothetical protein